MGTKVEKGTKVKVVGTDRSGIGVVKRVKEDYAYVVFSFSGPKPQKYHVKDLAVV